MIKILIIDDDPILLRTIRALLKEKYTVFITTSPKEAMSLLERHTPDIILLDYDMPAQNGLQTLELIRENENFDNIPVIFLTGSEDTILLDRLKKCSAGILQKPVRESELSEFISQHI